MAAGPDPAAGFLNLKYAEDREHERVLNEYAHKLEMERPTLRRMRRDCFEMLDEDMRRLSGLG